MNFNNVTIQQVNSSLYIYSSTNGSIFTFSPLIPALTVSNSKINISTVSFPIYPQIVGLDNVYMLDSVLSIATPQEPLFIQPPELFIWPVTFTFTNMSIINCALYIGKFYIPSNTSIYPTFFFCTISAGSLLTLEESIGDFESCVFEKSELLLTEATAHIDNTSFHGSNLELMDNSVAIFEGTVMYRRNDCDVLKK